MPLGGSVDIIAQVIEPAGTPPQRGTLVSFTTSLGTLQPTEAETDTAGRAIVRFLGGQRIGHRRYYGAIRRSVGRRQHAAASRRNGCRRQRPRQREPDALAGDRWNVDDHRPDARRQRQPARCRPGELLDERRHHRSEFCDHRSERARDDHLADVDDRDRDSHRRRAGGRFHCTADDDDSPPTTTPPPTQTPTPAPPASSGQAQGTVTVNVSSAPGARDHAAHDASGRRPSGSFTIAVTAATANGSAVRDVTVDWGDGSIAEPRRRHG